MIYRWYIDDISMIYRCCNMIFSRYKDDFRMIRHWYLHGKWKINMLYILYIDDQNDMDIFGLVLICDVCILNKCYANGVHVIYMWYWLVMRTSYVMSSFPRFFVSLFLFPSFLCFLVSSFPRFFVSSFLCFLVSSFLRFLVPTGGLQVPGSRCSFPVLFMVLE